MVFASYTTFLTLVSKISKFSLKKCLKSSFQNIKVLENIQKCKIIHTIWSITKCDTKVWQLQHLLAKQNHYTGIIWSKKLHNFDQWIRSKTLIHFSTPKAVATKFTINCSFASNNLTRRLWALSQYSFIAKCYKSFWDTCL